MISRRKFLTGGVGAACATTLSALPVLAAGNGETKLFTATDVHVRDYPTVQAVNWIGEELERQTGGRLRLRMFHSGQLGREAEAIDMARFNVIDITRVYSGALNNAFPLTQALCLPYVFDSVAHLRQTLDGDVGAEVLRGFEARGLVGLAIYDSGARCFYNTRRALNKPSDMHGLKIRVPGSDIFIQLIRLLGANPTPLSLGEAFSALETRLIDGAENNIRSFHSSRHFEAAGFWSQTEHSYAPDVLLMSRKSFDSLSPSDRQRVLEVSRQSVAVMRKLWDESESTARQAVSDYGVEMNTVDLPAFQRAAEPLLKQYRNNPAIDSLYRRIRDHA